MIDLATASFDELLAAGTCECGAPLDDHPPLRPPRPWGHGRPCNRDRSADKVRRPAPVQVPRLRPAYAVAAARLRERKVSEEAIVRMSVAQRARRARERESREPGRSGRIDG